MPKVVFSSTTSTVDWNTRLVTGDAVTEITRLKADDGGPMDICVLTLAAAARRAGLIDEYAIVTHPVLVGAGTPFFTALYSRVKPEPGGDPDVSRRRGADQVRDQGLRISWRCVPRRSWMPVPDHKAVYVRDPWVLAVIATRACQGAR